MCIRDRLWTVNGSGTFYGMGIISATVHTMASSSRGAGSLLKLVEPTGRGVWERESPSAVEMDPTSAHFDDMFRECLLAKTGLLICCHFVLSIVFMAALCNRGAIIFLPCSFFLSSFFLSFYGRPME